MMSKKDNFNSVAEYFNAQSEPSKKALLELKQCILNVIPDAIELINIQYSGLFTCGRRKTRTANYDCWLEKECWTLSTS